MLVNKINFLPKVNGTNNHLLFRGSTPVKPESGDIFIRAESSPAESQIFCYPGNQQLDNKIASLFKFLKKDPNITQKEALNTLYNIAMTDTLTGVNNKRALFVDLEELTGKLREEKKSLSVAMFDADNFKAINDLLGYDVGDEFIKTMGEEISNVAQKHGHKTYRFGGEEFFVLMPYASLEDAVEIAAEAQKNINQNSQLNSYYPLYIEKAHSLIKQFEEEQAPFESFRDKFREYKTIKKCLINHQEQFPERAEEANFIKAHLEQSFISAKEEYENLLYFAYARAEGEEAKKLLSSKLKTLENVNNPDEMYDTEMKAYFNFYFNKESQISQIKNWLSSMQHAVGDVPQGFTVTAGVKKYKDFSGPIEDYIKETGEVLSAGKKHLKGILYY